MAVRVDQLHGDTDEREAGGYAPSSESYYLAEISRFCTFSHEEQMELARSVVAGHEATARLTESMSAEERSILEEAVNIAHEARERLFEGNLRLALSVARRYLNQGLPLADLIQEANIGLLAGIDHFDPSLGFHFSTYAYWWIRQAITRSLTDHAHPIRVPTHIRLSVRQALRAADQNGSTDPVAIATAAGANSELARSALRAMAPVLALEVQTEDQTLEAQLPDQDAEDPAQEAEAESVRSTIGAALNGISQRERYVLARRFGLDGQEPASLAEVARQLKISRERTRQLEVHALGQLRSEPMIRELMG